MIFFCAAFRSLNRCPSENIKRHASTAEPPSINRTSANLNVAGCGTCMVPNVVKRRIFSAPAASATERYVQLPAHDTLTAAATSANVAFWCGHGSGSVVSSTVDMMAVAIDIGLPVQLNAYVNWFMCAAGQPNIFTQ